MDVVGAGTMPMIQLRHAPTCRYAWRGQSLVKVTPSQPQKVCIQVLLHGVREQYDRGASQPWSKMHSPNGQDGLAPWQIAGGPSPPVSGVQPRA